MTVRKYKSFTRLFSKVINTSVRPKRVSHAKAFQEFLLSNPNLMQMKPYIPDKYFLISRKPAEYLYLICPKTAKILADLMIPSVDLTSDKLIAETNAGLGLITTELLEKGAKLIRLYEPCPDFRKELKDFGKEYPGRVELFTKDIFHLNRYSFMDKQDRSNRVESLLRNIPIRSWMDDPVITVIGSMNSLQFIKYLIKSLAMQTAPTTYGRMQIFAIMRPRDYAVMSANVTDNLNAYQSWSILFNLLLDFEILEKISRNLFVPWESAKCLSPVFPGNLETDKLYFVKINFKKELPVSAENLLPLFHFVRQFYGKGNNRVIPTVEKWVPDCGLNIMLPTLNHDEYFEDINIFTKFRELTPHQILSVFKEMILHPSYSNSPFTALIESELVKTETIETSLADANLEKNIAEDIEEKLN